MPRDVPASLPAPSEARAGTDRAAALVPVGHRVAELLKPVRTVTRYRDGEFDGVQELWEPKPLNAADVPEVRRQLALVEAAMTPGDSGAVLARVYSLLAHYRGNDLPNAVEAAVAADWLDDVGGFPEDVVAGACRRWRRGPKMRYRPLPGEIREICLDLMGRLPEVASRLRRLLATVKSDRPEPTESRAADVQARLRALTAARKMP